MECNFALDKVCVVTLIEREPTFARIKSISRIETDQSSSVRDFTENVGSKRDNSRKLVLGSAIISRYNMHKSAIKFTPQLHPSLALASIIILQIGYIRVYTDCLLMPNLALLKFASDALCMACARCRETFKSEKLLLVAYDLHLIYANLVSSMSCR